MQHIKHQHHGGENEKYPKCILVLRLSGLAAGSVSDAVLRSLQGCTRLWRLKDSPLQMDITAAAVTRSGHHQVRSQGQPATDGHNGGSRHQVRSLELGHKNSPQQMDITAAAFTRSGHQVRSPGAVAAGTGTQGQPATDGHNGGSRHQVRSPGQVTRCCGG